MSGVFFSYPELGFNVFVNTLQSFLLKKEKGTIAKTKLLIVGFASEIKLMLVHFILN